MSARGLCGSLAAAAGVLLATPAGLHGTPQTGFDSPLATAAIDVCVQPARAAGIAAYAFDGRRLPFGLATGHEPGTRPRCGQRELRLLSLAKLTIDGQPAYLRRGGCATPCVVRQPTAHVLASELTAPVPVLGPAATGSDGRPAPGCTDTVRAAPTAAGGALGRMYYKTPRELHATHRRTGVIGAGARWSNYGDPGRRFSPAADYTYLLWNLPRRPSGALLPGGGIVEALIADGDTVALCDVARLTLPSFDVRGAPNGSVEFGYARARSGAQTIYGWILLGYRYRDGSFRATAIR